MGWFDRQKERLSRYAKMAFDHLRNGVRSFRRIHQAIRDGIKGREGFDGVLKRLRTAFAKSASDAKRIARTQMTKSENLARYEAGKQYQQETGQPVMKTWVCTFRNSRDSHKQLHGTTIPLDDDFHAIGGPMLYPGDDRRVGPEEIVNCRCYLLINGEKVMNRANIKRYF